MIDPASRFTLRQLSCFIATCERGGIGAAAEHLHLAQATVSAALADLERALGAQLLVRGRRRAATPSPAGRELLEEARAVLAAAARLGERAATLRGEVAGELPVGCLVTLAPVIAPAVCREFERRWPHAQVRLLPADQEALLAWLGDGTIALALTYDLGLDGEVDFRPLRPAPPYAIVAGGHPLARRKGVTLRELAPLPLVLLDLPLSRAYFLDLFREAGVEPLVERSASDPELVRSLVAQGYGYSLANARPAPTQAIDGAPLATVSVRGPARAPRIGLASRALLTPTRTADAFAEVCAELLV